MPELKTFSGRRASQNHHELTSFIQLLQERGVRRYLEIGARHGDTFHEIMLNLPVGSVGVAVDLPGGLWGTEKSRKHLKAAVVDLNRRGYKCTCLFGDSQTVATKQIIMNHGPYDALLIDGDHTLAGVSRDWELYRGLAPIVAFHDIVGRGEAEKVRGNPVEVPLFWAGVKPHFHHAEFVDADSKMGIGVVFTK